MINARVVRPILKWARSGIARRLRRGIAFCNRVSMRLVANGENRRAEERGESEAPALPAVISIEWRPKAVSNRRVLAVYRVAKAAKQQYQCGKCGEK